MRFGQLSNALMRQSSGRIIVIQRVGGEIVLLGLHPDGTRDVSFGHDGKARLDLPGRSGVGLGVIGSGDSITLVGSRREEGSFDSDVLVARFTRDGRPDLGFGGGDGWRTFHLGNIDSARALEVRRNGRVIVTGAVAQDVFGDEPSEDLFIAVLKPDGRLLRSFGDGGLVRDDFGRTTDAVIPLALEVAGGKILGAGQIGPGGPGATDMFAARYVLRAD